MKASRFILHARLAADTVPVAELPLSRVLLMNDARFPWLILVPRRAGVRELFELGARNRRQLIEEIALCGRALLEASRFSKLNIGALGNLVPQLHVHVVARTPGDDAWPGPVWGSGKPRPYSVVRRAALLRTLRLSIKARSRAR